MNAALEVQSTPAADSVLARARVHRQLTTEEAARRAGLPEEQVRWLEEGRVYRFPSADHALLAMLLYATALGSTTTRRSRSRAATFRRSRCARTRGRDSP